ncbi:hypothetical protein [Streptomyces niveus]|uniref:hypothetical protein n=1 Tax=Streptomyces niveus TaxID=193462 RepID=UPI00341FBE71
MAPRNLKILWVLIAALASLVIALVAGILISTTGVSLAEAVLYAGGVFGGSLVVVLAALSAVGVL